MPPLPEHLRKYLPGGMRTDDLDPNTWWNTDVIDLRLGKAVMAEWQAGEESGRQGHEAEEAMTKAIAERYGGQAQC